MSDNWPTPKFQFELIMDGQKTFFTEVSGLDIESQVIEYRAGGSKQFSTQKMPGLVKFDNITLKKGIFKSDSVFFHWFQQVKMNTIPRKTLTINLLDETCKPVMTWTLNNACPAKITGTDLHADGNEVAIETIEIAHEGLKISNR